MKHYGPIVIQKYVHNVFILLVDTTVTHVLGLVQ